MTIVLLVLVLLNILLVVGALLLIVRRTGSNDQAQIAAAVRATHGELRQDLGAQRAELRDSLHEVRRDSEQRLETIRATVDAKITALNESNQHMHRQLHSALREELERLRVGNESKLEKMRETVDEKLQGTLEKRLGESFELVSQRLEQVQKGLGEMQNLAADVGGLKRVLTNVKSRGTWGEVQLSRQLEDLLTTEQYAQNVVIRPESRDSVEFAVIMPGREEKPVYLPIDSKLPQEDYERLLDAQESGDKLQLDAASKALDRAITIQAKKIAEKYIEPPHSTDFAIMYLPTEGLFAEVVRRPGLASRLQTEHRVLVTGPTTLMSLLNSLQMGFRTLAIEKRSSEVWQVLSAAKAEFRKYGDVWDKLEKQLSTAQNTVKEAGTRTRAVERRLKDVQSLPEEPVLEQALGR
ncbi:DNA recombination protein RmuC [Arthrobacter sp. MYb224]|uniref:DNA recombination protein RmuC n=1 Tax=unclassified Arthrobacter TaxID=235627 RepID=UPI000CFD463D|nr:MULTISPECIES: DNA recombination protein RmuC [unclassified Arthrobacter]PQZ97746.1 DNA recombination protein RmuC [Arthrobacter sp. MYb224]PRA04022.1 DNA recombination protein RmuC [Arthrobacter sp. MYb229]PRB52066.1 DNA recombination protein RmuC [Arthrobacter sp. MYb216]